MIKANAHKYSVLTMCKPTNTKKSYYYYEAKQKRTGLRFGEITGLRWCDIDFEDETININHTLAYYNKGKVEGCVYAVNTPKTEAGKRNVPILPKVNEVFLLEKQYQEKCGIKYNVATDG